MQAVAAELSGYAGKPPPLFELRRVRRRMSTEREQRVNLGQRVAGRNQQKEFSRRATPVARERNPTAPRVPTRHQPPSSPTRIAAVDDQIASRKIAARL